jgi:hypothetical protein
MGRVEEHHGSFVVTQLIHYNYMSPLRLRSFLVLEGDVGPAAAIGESAIRRSMPLKLPTSSVLAGYLRAWASVGAALFLPGALSCHAELRSTRSVNGPESPWTPRSRPKSLHGRI